MNALNDLEFRVWSQYLLSADDGGIMRMSALTIQADNDSLATRPIKKIEAALAVLVESGLLRMFEHQGRKYVCDPKWQDFQHVQWPRESHNPMPPKAIIDEMSEQTRSLLENILKRSSSEHRKGHRLKAKANGTGLTLEANGIGARFERFWECYPRKVGKDAARREFDILAPDNDLTDRMCAAVDRQRASAQWTKNGGEFIPHPRTWLHQGRWQDEDIEAPTVSTTTAMLAKATREFLGDD